MQPKEVIYELTASSFEWEISKDKTVQAWGFNQQVPGPTIRANKGDTLIVKVKNELEEPTIIHWHGIRLQSSMDGTGEVQQPIQPGAEFEYRFTVPDAGTFWYHSHHNETVQVERGMYGALIVEEETEIKVDNERVFMIDDMKLNDKYEFKRGNFFQRWAERHDGREGDTLLINGKKMPYIQMHAGQTERWRFINSSSARYFMLNLEGRPFRIIGTDGGLIEKPIEATRVLLTPGERLEILAGPFKEEDSFFIESLPYNRMTFLKPKKQSFARVLVGKEKPSIAFVPEKLRKIKALAKANAPVNRTVKLSVGASLKNGIDFLVNNEVHANDKPVIIGELQVWEIANTSLMDHPFHLHGFFFQVLERNGVEPEYVSWKDTINIAPRSKVKIAWIPDNRPGIWMYHCHILEHHEAGMMANFEVIDPEVGELHAGQHTHHHHH
ncbi:MAG TPA: multicopper oxidase family protein [Chitinophagaceae bacterium]|nr:multicopper oxidase family protein [Chitinophagaceae bacterium]